MFLLDQFGHIILYSSILQNNFSDFKSLNDAKQCFILFFSSNPPSQFFFVLYIQCIECTIAHLLSLPLQIKIISIFSIPPQVQNTVHSYSVLCQIVF